jgi:hypothetical protein
VYDRIARGFGEPGFYFVVHKKTSEATARYVRSLKEEIRVYAAENDSVRADGCVATFQGWWLVT